MMTTFDLSVTVTLLSGLTISVEASPGGGICTLAVCGRDLDQLLRAAIDGNGDGVVRKLIHQPAG